MQKSSLPKVSIITVSYNSSKTIRDTIESIKEQSYPNIEYIVVDGGSTDGTQEIVKTYGSLISKFVSESDDGLYDAMNKGIQMATGEVVGILNSDDYYYDKDSISLLVNRMEESGTDSVFADLIFFDPEQKGKIVRYYKSGPWSPWMLRFGKMPAHPTFLIKKSHYEQLGMYSLDYKIASDYEFLVRSLYKAKVSFSYLPKPVVKMRAGGVSTQGVKSSILLNQEIVEACRRNGVWTSLPVVLLKIPFKLAEVAKYKVFSNYISDR